MKFGNSRSNENDYDLLCVCANMAHSSDRDLLTAAQFGVGPIGSEIVVKALERDANFIGAIDIDPEKIDEDLGEVIGYGDEIGVKVQEDPEDALSGSPDIVFHSTASSLDAVKGQLIQAMEMGCNVISTTEELSYPWLKNEGIANKLDKIARENGVTCLGTGINPGFVMDTFPAVLSTPLREVHDVRVERVQNAGDRRDPLQKKVGAGLSKEEFNEEIAGNAGHVGSEESISMLASALGWELDEVSEQIEPIIAEEQDETGYVTVEPGDVAGIHQHVKGYQDGLEKIILDLKMYVGADPYDAVEFSGEPTVEIEVKGGYHGDICTASLVANVADSVVKAESGLKSMVDLSSISYKDMYRLSQ